MKKKILKEKQSSTLIIVQTDEFRKFIEGQRKVVERQGEEEKKREICI